MKSLVCILIFIYAFCAVKPLSAQNNKIIAADSLLFTFVYMKTGDVYVGSIIKEDDEIVTLKEVYLGNVSLLKKNISSYQYIFKNSKVILSLAGNSKYTGNLIRVDNKHYALETKHLKEVLIPRQDVANISFVKKKEVLHNPNATRYFFGPSAIPIDKGWGYYQNAYLLSNSVNFGLTKSFTLGGGIIIPLLFYVTPKVGVKVSENLYAGAGLIAGSTFIPDAVLSGGIPFGVITYGSDEHNLSIASGYGFLWEEGDFTQTHYPITTISGMSRISNRIQLVSENWIIPYKHTQEYYMVNGEETRDTDDYEEYDEFGNYIEPEVHRTAEVTDLYMAISLGLRVIVSDRTTIDFAPVFLKGAENNIMVPYLDLVYKF